MKKLILLLLFSVFALTLISCSKIDEIQYCRYSGKDDIYICQKDYSTYFDTIISLQVYVDDSKNYEYDIEEIFTNFENLAKQYHQYFDKYHAYPEVNNLYTINNTEGPVIIDEELYQAIAFAKANEDITSIDGVQLFNIALDPVLRVWHESRNSDACYLTLDEVEYCPVPSEESLAQDFNIDPNDIIMDDDNFSIDFAKDNMGIDLGGFAKGYFTDIAKDYLNQFDLNYILNMGNSNVYVHGENPLRETGYFILGLTTPFRTPDEEAYYAKINLTEGLSLVSSGVYQRYFMNSEDLTDETLYHHIINPKTFYPGGEVMSVTILCDNATMGDILSTTIFLMSLEEGLNFVNNYEGLEAIWYVDKGEVVMSDNFGDYLAE